MTSQDHFTNQDILIEIFSLLGLKVYSKASYIQNSAELMVSMDEYVCRTVHCAQHSEKNTRISLELRILEKSMGAVKQEIALKPNGEKNRHM